MSVNLLDYFVTTAKNNEDNRIQYPSTKYVGKNVGNGKYKKMTKQEVVFDGKIDKSPIKKYNGPFGLTLTILDENQCSIIYNGDMENGKYKKDGIELQVVTSEATYHFYAGDKGTYITGMPNLPGKSWIGK